MLVGARQRVVAEPARRVQRPRGDRPARRLVRARPRHRRPEHAAAGRAGPTASCRRRPGPSGSGTTQRRRRPRASRRSCRPASAAPRAAGLRRRAPAPRAAPAAASPPARRRARPRPGRGAVAAQQQLHQRVAPRLRGALQQRLLARVPGHRGVREAVDVGEDRLGEHAPATRGVQRRLGAAPRRPATPRGRRRGRPTAARRACGPRGTRPGRSPRRRRCRAGRRRARADPRTGSSAAAAPSRISRPNSPSSGWSYSTTSARTAAMMSSTTPGQPRAQQIRHLGRHGRPRQIERGPRLSPSLSRRAPPSRGARRDSLATHEHGCAAQRRVVDCDPD